MIAHFILSLCVGCAALIGGTLVVGGYITPPVHASLLASNSCLLPCIFGVTPGATTGNDAMLAFERLGLSYSYLSPNQSASFTMRGIVLGSGTTRSLMALLTFGQPASVNVSAVHLYQMASAHELGILSDFLLAGYRPSRILANCQNEQRIFVLFENQPLMVQVVVEDQLQPEAAVVMVSSASDTDGLTPVGGFACDAETHWMGFAPTWKYQS